MLRLLLPLVLLLPAMTAAAADVQADVTLRVEDRGAQPQSLVPATPPSGVVLQAELRHTLRLGGGLALQGNALLAHQRLDGQGGSDASRINELNAAWDLGAWQLSAGKKLLGWDVGYAFRPNDVVQQENRRVQFEQTPEGRPLLQVERFDADTAWALVLAQPQNWNDRGAFGVHEAALAARVYRRIGALDLHGFARQGRHSGPSLGAAAAWVATDELELHASARVFRRHDGWAFDGNTVQLSATLPWHMQTLGGGSAWLVGAQWTGGPRLSVLAEAWHDGRALSDRDWDDWARRNVALRALAGAAANQAVMGNLAWQATPFDAPSLRRDNLFLRLAWQPEDWTLSLDALVTPADRGRVLTAALQWKGDRWRVDASLRAYGGPAASLSAQLPLRRTALLAVTRSF
ncbi:MAG: hypothetical protein QM750_07330 [Rubrivivax sp.]